MKRVTIEELYQGLLKSSNKWEEFSGIQNTNDGVLKKASSLANMITSVTPKFVEVFQHGISSYLDEKLDDSLSWNVYYDFILYMIHLSDRAAFHYLDKDKRTLFLNRLYDDITDYLRESFKSETTAKKFLDNFAYQHGLFQKEYSQYTREKPKSFLHDIDYQFTERIFKRFRIEIDYSDIKQMTFIMSLRPIINGMDIVYNFQGLLVEK